jgi:hypothetical protein
MHFTQSSLGKVNRGHRNRLALIIAKHWVRRGKFYLSRGATKKALQCSKRALSYCGHLKKAHNLMAMALFPGDDYIAILSNFHKKINPATYVEIGVATGTSLAQVRPKTKAIGIDPRPCISNEINSRAKLYPLGSNEFFASYDLFEELGEARLDFAFIDGAHLFEQALRDFANLERYAHNKTIITTHDCLPITPLVTARERASSYWCGDVWKLIPCLKAYRPDLDISIIPTFPSGLGVITNLDPDSTTLRANFEKIISEYKCLDLDYDYLDLHRVKLAKMMPNNWEIISQTIIGKN